MNKYFSNFLQVFSEQYMIYFKKYKNTFLCLMLTKNQYRNFLQNNGIFFYEMAEESPRDLAIWVGEILEWFSS